MDINELILECKDFLSLCNKKGYPIKHACLVEAYQGDPTTSYVLHIGGNWIKNMNFSTALEIMIDFMWDSMSQEARSKIFSIKIYDQNKSFQCASGQLELIAEDNAA
jgi:hypothetical protein